MLKQRYRLLRLVGKGGFGAVYAAEDLTLGNRLVAAKEMSQSGLTTRELQEATDSFQREAQLLARLKHPGLPAIYDYFSEAGRWYLIMEFIFGETLEARLNKAPGGRLPVQEVLKTGLQLCDVLEHLHGNHPPIIFRDLKPSNVMVTAQGGVYLIDFGIARVFKPGQAKDTTAFGSPGYAAPEQYGKMQTTAQSDIYSLGATLHQMLSGRDPSDSLFNFAPLALPNPGGLETLVLQMVERDQSKRPATMSLIKQQLQQMVDGQNRGRGNANSPSKTPGASLHSAWKAFSQTIKDGIASPYAQPGSSMPPPANTGNGRFTQSPHPVWPSNPAPATTPQPQASTFPLRNYVCPVCFQQHQLPLTPGHTYIACPRKNKACSLLIAKTRVKRSHKKPGSSNIHIYQIRVILPDKSERMIDFPSKDGHFELRAGDEVIIAFYKEQPKVVLNATIHRYMVVAN